MIRINGESFYISAGETCYIFKAEDGILKHVYFGKRVEPEDDLSALGYDGKADELIVQVETNGKKATANLVFASADVQDNEDGKSLVVELDDKKLKLKAYVYYTPQPRGGISRHVVIKYLGVGTAVITDVRQQTACAIGAEVFKNKAATYAVAVADVNNENHGAAYGYLCVGGVGSVTAEKRDAAVTAVCGIGDAVTIDNDEEYACPEMLCVYSDNGIGGASRIFHDILRERAKNNGLSERTVALFLPKPEEAEVRQAVNAAVEMGFGIVAVDGGECGSGVINALAAACREQGISPGLRVCRDEVKEGSALFGATSNVKQLLKAVRGIIAQNDIKYVMLSMAEPERSMFALKNKLTAEFDGLFVDYGIQLYEQSKEMFLCYPLGYVRNIIAPLPAESFKSRFDCATLGTLGYRLNPLELQDGLKRAVRAQILSYQDDAFTVMRGDIYRCGAGCSMAVSKDKAKAYAVCQTDGAARVKLEGLDEHNLYHVREMDKTFSGAALVHCGITLNEAGTYVLHIRQVADF